MYTSGFGTDAIFNAAPFIIGLGFIVMICMIIFAGIKGASTWNKNNNSPRLTVSAFVATKRANVSHHSNIGQDDNMVNSYTNTDYYVTFQVESGDRMEFHITGQEYGMLAEGDRGELTFQGTRYLSFNRNIEEK